VPWSSGASHAGDISCCVGVLSNVGFDWHVLSLNEGGCMWYVDGWKRGGLKMGWAFVSYVETKKCDNWMHKDILLNSRVVELKIQKNTELKSMTLITETNTLIYRMLSFTHKSCNNKIAENTNNQKVAYCWIKRTKNIMHPRSWLDPQSYHPGQEKQILSIATAIENTHLMLNYWI
jgi:hypothetical protein